MDNALDKEMKYISKNELSVTEDEKQLNLFRSMYYQLNAKPDSVSKVFSRRIEVSREDIIDLNERVRTKIRMHCKEDDGYIATIIVSLSNKQIITFECWEKFITYKWNETANIKNIILKWNFNVRMPQYSYPQTHVLMVKISSGLKPEEMLNLIFSGKIEDFDEVETNAFPVAARVDFIDPLLGEELLNVVSKWVEGLKSDISKKNPFLLLLRKYRKKVAYYFNYVAFACMIFVGVALINKILKSFDVQYVSQITIEQLRYFINILVIISCILVVSLKVLDRLAQRIYNELEGYGNSFIFNITKGDERRQEEIDNNSVKSGKTIIINLIFSLIFNVTCSIIATIILH